MTKSVRFLSVSNKLSGAELYIAHLADAVRKEGINVQLSAPLQSPLARHAADLDFEVQGINIGPKLSKRTALRTLRTFWKQRRVLKTHLDGLSDEEIVVLHFKLEQLLIATIPGTRDRYAFLEHGPIPSLILTFRPAKYLYQLGARKARALFAASVPAADAIASLGYTAKVLRPEPEPRHVAEAMAQRPVVRQELAKLGEDRTILCYAGRLNENKGILAVAHAVAESSKFGLVVMGSGGQEAAIKNLAKQTKHICYLGSVKNPLPVIAASDFGVLMTSDPGEGRPLFGIECVSVGTPLVGLRASRAMQGLEDEYGKDWVRLVGDVGDLSEACRKPVTGAVPTTSGWSGPAIEFLEHMDVQIVP